jgi:hypothetical protein
MRPGRMTPITNGQPRQDSNVLAKLPIGWHWFSLDSSFVDIFSSVKPWANRGCSRVAARFIRGLRVFRCACFVGV